MVGIYIHIPYCRRLCPYCDFLRRATPGDAPASFIDALCREIGEYSGPDVAGSVFLGGGTPSLVRGEDLGRILNTVRKRFRLVDPEISVEANPDDVTADLAQSWRDAGVNRVSLGVQSFDDEALRYLGRRHDAARAISACETVSRRFDNWAMDLIFGAGPVDAWESTLAQCVALAPAHVSTYGLTYETGTPFYSRRHEAVDEEQWLDLYRRGERALAGYAHYEISNYARQNYECRHNLLYWRNEDYVGFGPGAYSFLGGVRMRNSADVEGYASAPTAKEERLELSEREIKVETLIQHFRLHRGMAKEYYLKRFGTDVMAEFGDVLADLVARGLLEEDKEIIRPTRAGFELNNEIGLALVG